MRLALVIASDYQQSAQLPTLSRSLEDADRFAAYLDGSDLDIGIEELSADRHFPEQFEEALREPGAPLSELIVYFAGYVVTAPGRDPSLILDGDRLGAFALPRLRRLVEETSRRALVVIDAVAVAHDGATPEEIADAIGSALGRHGALSVLVNVSASADAAFASAGVGTSFTDLLSFCWDTALKSDASETELSGLDVFELMRAEPAFDAFPAARYFPGRVDFDWATGTLESDHEISGLRSASDDDVLGSGNGFGASFPHGSPLPSFSTHHAAPASPSASGMPRSALASPLPAPPEALAAAAASVTFSSVPALRVPPPPPRSAPPPPPRSVPPPLPSSPLPPPRSAIPPALAVPPPLPARSVPPPPLPGRSAPPLPAAFAFPAPPPLPVPPSSALPPPWPAPSLRTSAPLLPLQASLPDQEEELTEPGHSLAEADDVGLEVGATDGFEGETHAPTLINHGGFGEVEDTEVTTSSGPLRALGSFEPTEAEAGDAEGPASEDFVSAGPASESPASESPASDAVPPEAELAEAVTSSDAVLTELLAMDVASPEAGVAAVSDASDEAASGETELPEAAAVELAAPPAALLTSEEDLSIEALLREPLPTDALAMDATAEAAEPTAAEAAARADAPSAADEPRAPEIAVVEPQAPAAPLEQALAKVPGEASEPVADASASEPESATAAGLPTPGVGRRTLPSDFVTSVLEEAGVAMGGAVPETTAEALPSVLPPDLVPRKLLETDPGAHALAEVELSARAEPASALPSDLVERALFEAGVVASELPPRGERDVLDVFDAGEAEALEARESFDDEDALEPSVPFVAPESRGEPSLLTRDESAPDSDRLEHGGDEEPMPSFELEAQSDPAPVTASEPPPASAVDGGADRDSFAGEAPTEAPESSERMPSFALDEDDDDAAEVSALRERSARLWQASSEAEPLPSFAGDDDAAGDDDETASAAEALGESPEHQPMPSFASEEFADDTEIYAPPRGGPGALPPPLIHAPLPPPLVHSSPPPLPTPSLLPPPLVHSSLPPPLVHSSPPPPVASMHSPLPPPLLHSSPPPPLSGLAPGAPDLASRGVLTEGDAEAAFDATLPELPPFDTCLAQGDALLAEGDVVNARSEYERALEHAPADRAGVAYGRLGALSRQLGEREAAVMNYEIALELSSGDAGPLVALTELCVESAEFSRVEGYQRRYLEGQRLPDGRAEVWAAMAELWSEHARDPERHRLVLTQWAEDLPEDPTPVALLATGYHELGEHTLGIEVRQRLAERIQDPLRKAAELVEVARAVCGYLRDGDLAIRISLEALELNPGSVEAVEIVTALLEHEQRWQELAAIYERIVAGMGDHALQRDVGPKLGALYRDKLGAPDRTISAYERVLEGDPGRSDVRRQLVELYTARGEHALALLHCRRALKADPNDHELYRRVYSLLDKLGETDAAWNAAMVLDCLGEADINEQLVADAHRPSGLLSPKGTVPEEFWGHGLLSPERDRALGEILAAVEEAAVELRASLLRKKKRLPKLTPEARHDLNTSTTTLAKSLLWTSKLLSVKAPELYVLDEVPGDLTAAPSDTPSALVSKSLARGLSLAQLAFLWGRHLTLFRPEHYVFVFYPSVDDLVMLVCAALVAGECPRYGEQAASADAKKLGRDLRKKLHPGSYARLAAACTSFDPRDLEGRVCAWLRAVELTRGRAGLLACGDVAVAAELVRRHPVVGQTAQEDQVSDLLCFSVSDEYAKLRGRLGVAIA